MRYLNMALIGVLLAGCTGTGIIQVNADTYMVSSTGTSPLRSVSIGFIDGIIGASGGWARSAEEWACSGRGNHVRVLIHLNDACTRATGQQHANQRHIQVAHGCLHPPSLHGPMAFLRGVG